MWKCLFCSLENVLYHHIRGVTFFLLLLSPVSFAVISFYTYMLSGSSRYPREIVARGRPYPVKRTHKLPCFERDVNKNMDFTNCIWQLAEIRNEHVLNIEKVFHCNDDMWKLVHATGPCAFKQSTYNIIKLLKIIQWNKNKFEGNEQYMVSRKKVSETPK